MGQIWITEYKKGNQVNSKYYKVLTEQVVCFKKLFRFTLTASVKTIKCNQLKNKMTVNLVIYAWDEHRIPAYDIPAYDIPAYYNTPTYDYMYNV